MAQFENELHRIAVTGIVWKEEDGVRKYLITKRAPHKKVLPNKWTVPGGGMEVNDYVGVAPSHHTEQGPQWYGVAERTLRREIKEEVRVVVGTIQYLTDLAFVTPDGVPMVVL